ncbi:MAG: phosphate ABC transporter substrate-binding protein [Gammaproteobacteria bacterium]|nr:phosphate ABC transporter substrate-binding protein [Gammaproteobacteria bacterium]MBT8135362.1 phosphate ABC transporter substrate-binding protein [Gammaproteobacteria bacterium]NNJ50994.1 phosphate ABC transporter substrate-binding protein [Gammaproteobacteria bacterium]
MSALLLLFIASTANADLAIIIHPDSETGDIDTQNVRKLFLGERKAFPNGHHAKPINHTVGSPDRKEFFSLVLNMPEKTHRRHWKRKIAVGAGSSPTELGSHSAVLKSIANTPGSIGYIDASKVDDSVKVILIVQNFNEV